MAKYDIRCDECKKKIGSTNSIGESAQGGRCQQCRKKYVVEVKPRLKFKR